MRILYTGCVYSLYILFINICRHNFNVYLYRPFILTNVIDLGHGWLNNILTIIWIYNNVVSILEQFNLIDDEINVKEVMILSFIGKLHFVRISPVWASILQKYVYRGNIEWSPFAVALTWLPFVNAENVNKQDDWNILWLVGNILDTLSVEWAKL